MMKHGTLLAVKQSNKSVPACQSVSIKHTSAVKNILQPKLKIGQADDKYEREADRVAEHILNSSNLVPKGFADNFSQKNHNTHTRNIHNQTDALLAKSITPIHYKTNEGEADLTPDVSKHILSFQYGGQPMSESHRNFFEPRFGTDFSNVRLHKNSNSATVAKTINARAFTLGNHIVFGSGEYQPETLKGKSLFAHELTHIVQQSGLPSTNTIKTQLTTNKERAFNDNHTDNHTDNQLTRINNQLNPTTIQCLFNTQGIISGRLQLRERLDPYTLAHRFRFPVRIGTTADWRGILSGNINRALLDDKFMGFILTAMRPEIAQSDEHYFSTLIYRFLQERGHTITREESVYERAERNSEDDNDFQLQRLPLRILDYVNSAVAPNREQKIDFVRALYSTGDELSLPSAVDIGTGLAGIDTQGSAWRLDIFRAGLRVLISRYQNEILNEIAADPERRMITHENINAVAENVNNRTSHAMIENAGATAFTGVGLYLAGSENTRIRAQAIQTIQNAGETIRAVVQVLEGRNTALRSNLGALFDFVWNGLKIAFPVLASPVATSLKMPLKNLFIELMLNLNQIDPENMIESIRLNFSRMVRNMGDEDSDPMSPEQASILINTFISSQSSAG